MSHPLVSSPAALDAVLARPDVWRAGRGLRNREALPSGHPALDEALHDGGWPLGASTELLMPELDWPLLLPALRQRLQQHSCILLVAPPLLPSSRYLAAQGIASEQLVVVSGVDYGTGLWVADQALRAGCCALVCQWLPARGVSDRDLRQLQYAAACGGSWHLLLRPAAAAQQAAPAALRLEAQRTAAGQLQLTVLKQRGGWAGQQVSLQLWPQLAELASQPLLDWPTHFAELPSLPQRALPERSARLSQLARVQG